MISSLSGEWSTRVIFQTTETSHQKTFILRIYLKDLLQHYPEAIVYTNHLCPWSSEWLSTYLLFVYATILNIVSVSSESKEETIYKVVLLSYSIIYPEKWLGLRALRSGTVAHHKFWYSLQSCLYFSSLKWSRKKSLTRRDYYELRSFCKYLAPARAITVLTASTKIWAFSKLSWHDRQAEVLSWQTDLVSLESHWL